MAWLKTRCYTVGAVANSKVSSALNIHSELHAHALALQATHERTGTGVGEFQQTSGGIFEWWVQIYCFRFC